MVRLPFFRETCPHIKDQIVDVNGGRLNLDHLFRVLRARAALEHMTLPLPKPMPKVAT